MKLKLIPITITAIISIIFAGCANMDDTILNSTSMNNTISTEEPVKTIQTTKPKDTLNYSNFTGEWNCKDKKTDLHIKVNVNGDVKGSITTVVGSHVPSCYLYGTIKNDILIAKLYDADGENIIDKGTLTLSFANLDEIKGNVNLNDNNSTYKEFKIAEGEMLFQKNNINVDDENNFENHIDSIPVPKDNTGVSNDNTTVTLKDNQKILDSLIYTNTNYGFTLTFPEAWKGKCYLEENDYGIMVYYGKKINNKISIPFFGIGRANKSEWVGESGAPVEEICEQNGYVYYADLPDGDAPFDLDTKNGEKEAEEYTNLNKDTQSIIKSLKVID